MGFWICFSLSRWTGCTLVLTLRFFHPLITLSFYPAGGKSPTVLHRTSQPDRVHGEQSFAPAKKKCTTNLPFPPFQKSFEAENKLICANQNARRFLQNAKALFPFSEGTWEPNLRNSELCRFGLEFLLCPRTTCEFLKNSPKNSSNVVVSLFRAVELQNENALTRSLRRRIKVVGEVCFFLPLSGFNIFKALSRRQMTHPCPCSPWAELSLDSAFFGLYLTLRCWYHQLHQEPFIPPIYLYFIAVAGNKCGIRCCICP